MVHCLRRTAVLCRKSAESGSGGGRKETRVKVPLKDGG